MGTSIASAPPSVEGSDVRLLLRPDYRGLGLVNLMASIVVARGGAAGGYPPTPLLEAAALARHRNLVLIVIDGLGYEFLRARGDCALARDLKGRLTSVFPTTTATAVTTFLTGTAPQQHGLTGWHMYFKEIDRILAVLPFRVRHGERPLTRTIDAHKMLGHKPVFDLIADESHLVSPIEIIDSDFNNAHSGRARKYSYQTLAQFTDAIAAAVHGSPARKYAYGYWPRLDTLAHEFGCNAAAVIEHFHELDAAYDDLRRTLAGSDTLLIVTADHGFIDNERTVDLSDHPALAETLARPLCGEPRVAYCYVKAKQRRAFERYVSERLSAEIALIETASFIDAGFFGVGAPHPALADRAGDYVLIARDRVTIRDRLPGEPRFTQIGVHGGLSAEELYVPLITATTSGS